ncbi:MAG: class I SAM-dependent methyltransferase, partial [Candidatus Omnitrophota bacterium]
MIPSKSQKGYKEYPCDICGSRDAIEVPHVRTYTGGQAIHICIRCGFIYVKKRRPYDIVAGVWSKQLFGKAYTSRSPLMLARHTYIAEFIDQRLSLKNKKVCDVGAGEGQFLRIVKKEYGAPVFGVEPSRTNCKILKNSGIRCFQGTLQECVQNKRVKDYQADILTLMWTLENATAPRPILMEARKIIKKNGYIVVATGSRILVPFSKPLNLYLSRNPADTHPARFSANTLNLLLATCGFKVKHINPYLNDALMLCMIAQKTKVPK